MRALNKNKKEKFFKQKEGMKWISVLYVIK